MKRKTKLGFTLYILVIIISSLISPKITNTFVIPIGSSIKSSHQEIIENLIKEERYEYPPYIERYKATWNMWAIEADNTNKRLFFPMVKDKLGVYYLENKTIQEYTTPFAVQTVTNLAFDVTNDNLFIGTFYGFYIMNLQFGNITLFNETIVDFETFAYNENYIYSMVFDELNEILYLNTFAGLRGFYTNNFTFLKREHISSQLYDNPTGEITLNTQMNLLYLTSGNYVLSYNPTSKEILDIFSTTGNYGNLFYNEENNTLLISDGINGISILNCSSNVVLKKYNTSTGLLTNVVDGITYTPYFGGLIFAKQDYNGFVVINTSSDEIHLFRREHGLLSNIIGSFEIYENTSQSFLIIGCSGGISKFNIEKLSFVNSIVFGYDLPIGFTNKLTIDSQTQQVFLSVDEFICIYNITSKQFTNYDYVYGLSEAYMTETVYDYENNLLFVGTSRGLNIFNLTSEEVGKTYTTEQGLAYNDIRSLYYVNETHDLYVGTSQGLCVISLDTEQVKNFTGTEILTIHDILFDNKSNRLYLGTNNGLKIVDLQTDVVETLILGATPADYYINDIEKHVAENLLFVSTSNGLYTVNLEKLAVENHYTFENSKLTINDVGGLFFDQESEKLYMANLGVVIYDYKHDFWINLNDAYLEEEELFFIYITDIAFYDDVLYFTASSKGFYTINMTDSDQDGIENCFEEWIYATDHLQYDTDNDTFGDGFELWAGTDPLDPESFPQNHLEWWIIAFIIILSLLLLVVIVLTILFILRSVSSIYNKEETSENNNKI